MSRHRRTDVPTAEIPQLDRTVGADGKERPSRLLQPEKVWAHVRHAEQLLARAIQKG